MRASKRLGQHFLTDRNILRRIVDAVEPAPSDVVIEIGAGHGSLTRELAPRVRQVFAIEKDRRLAEDLHEATGKEPELRNVSVVQGDALRVDWQRFGSDRPKFVGNIPYNITTPLLERVLDPPLPELVVFLVQQEVADRVVAAPGSKTYGGLTIGIQAVCRAEKLFTVRAGAFRPAPKVQSAVLRLRPKHPPLIDPSETSALRSFVTACFSRRRKQLKNAVPGMTEADLRALGFDPTVRPERLPPEAFVLLLRRSRQL